MELIWDIQYQQPNNHTQVTMSKWPHPSNDRIVLLSLSLSRHNFLGFQGLDPRYENCAPELLGKSGKGFFLATPCTHDYVPAKASQVSLPLL